MTSTPATWLANNRSSKLYTSTSRKTNTAQEDIGLDVLVHGEFIDPAIAAGSSNRNGNASTEAPNSFDRPGCPVSVMTDSPSIKPPRNPRYSALIAATDLK